MLYCFARRVTNTSQALTRRRYLPRMTRRGVRVAEGARLESVFSRNRDVGSNPTLSAILRPARRGYGWRAIWSLGVRWQAITYFGMWYVYILRSKADGKLYVGSTADLRRRLQEHREGQSQSTRNRRPLELEAYIAVKEESIARDLEKYLKTGSGIATLRTRILTSEVRRT